MLRVITIWNRVKRFFSPGIKFHSRRSKFKWYLGVGSHLVSLLSIVFLFGIGFFYVNVFELPSFQETGHAGDDRRVNISEADIYTVESRYDSGLEKGFCVYGYTTDDYIVVEDVVHDDNPVVQENDSISFLCIDETLERLPEMFLNNEYNLIGNVHTHPDVARLSRSDSFTFGALGVLQSTFGVYDGEDLAFFTAGSLSYSLEMNIENTISEEQYRDSSGINT